ncbi:SAM-dependent methyltransferase [Nitrosovibrio sp. Nv17]|jgi:16S rRNA (cytidine1402-2'-O)-methyltransferase|uniref:SAM-dependent methyltransferase n=1 Tax=Nitrosovibrio sp. Nv17 TaxID=1855339 RepID=UPI0009087C45|nr:SAM-dependent methyltransferase [Nitrosovibrio sp. Nv17]SFW29174.1 16S rRNA (cytidine1402-2'-O)-methyltransferase [Nitrosovibrio sp. Nv17]
MTPGTLYLIPTPLGEEDGAWTIPSAARQCVARLDHYVVEHPRTARRFLKRIGCALPLQQISMQVLDEHTPPREVPDLLAPLLSGHDVGLLSEAGCPTIADPGAELVRLAHQHHLRVVPLVGPSSLLLALMASGLNGQRFVFHGYLPRDRSRRTEAIMRLERDSIVHDRTQIFIETPYRNQALLESLISVCRAGSALCIASSLTLKDEYISTRRIDAWQHAPATLDGKPAIFLLQG